MTQHISPSKSFNIDGETKELLISFSAQQKIVNLYGGLEGLSNLFIDPMVQTQAVIIVLKGKETNSFETVQDFYDVAENYSAEVLNEILLWLQDYFTNFTMTQTQKMTQVVSQGKAVAEKTKQN